MNMEARMVYFSSKVFQSLDSASVLSLASEGWRECF